METIITVENGNTLAALQGFLRQLLEHGFVDAVVTPLRTPSGTVTPALVTKTELLATADPLAPVLPGNSATLVGKLSVREPCARIGVVLRSCEIRALVELVKMKQASLDNVTVIAIDCAGTYHVPVFQKLTPKGDILWQELYQNAAIQPDKPDDALRVACKICEQPVYDSATIKIKLLGGDPDQAIQLELPDEMATQLGYSPTTANGRQAVVDKLIAARVAARDVAFAEIRTRLEGEEGIAGVFAACIRCHNCMTVCPICYCKTCVFKSQVFDHEPMQFVEWAKQKGAYRLPSDTMLFHLTRLNHMGLSCVGCGMCTEACPAELPVGIVFRAIGQRLQATFEYIPGRDKEEQLPLVTFKADEWTEVGE